MKKLFIRVLPFLVALIMGVTIYLIAELLIKNEGLNNLIINVASGLISIPLVFIFYEVINKVTSRNLHNSLFESIAFEVNSRLVRLVIILLPMVGMKGGITSQNLADLPDLDVEDIIHKIKFSPKDIQMLTALKGDFNAVVHRPILLEVLSENQMMALLNISRQIGFLAKNLHLIQTAEKGAKKNAAENIVSIGDSLEMWLEDGEKEALENHARFDFEQGGRAL